jgi:hypothetical protein
MNFDSAPFRALKRFSGAPMTDAEAAAQLANIRGLSHRGTVSLGASILDDAVMLCLRSRMRRLTPTETYQLFEESGPLSSFAARIDMAYAFSLIGKKTSEALHIIRLMRDSASHPRNAFSFDEPEIKAAALLVPPSLSTDCKWRNNDFSDRDGDGVRDLMADCITLLRGYVLLNAYSAAPRMAEEVKPAGVC